MKNKKNKKDFFKVVAVEGNEAADIILYGYIGQEEWWSESDENDITDIAFIKKIKELEKSYQRINIRINSPGGSMYHGNAIISAIRNSTADIHTYNDGLAASMAADIWLSAPNRHMATNAIMMIHAASTIAFGTAKELRAAAAVADKFTETAITVCSEAMNKDAEEVAKMFYNDYEDHWISYNEAKGMDFITTDEEYEAEAVLENIESMKFSDIMKHFASTGDDEATGLLDQIQAKFKAAMKLFVVNHSQNKQEEDMNIEELKQSIQDGSLSLEDLQKVIQEQEPSTPEPKALDADAVIEMIEDAINKATEPLLTKINNQTETIEAQAEEIETLNAAPGATITKAPAKPSDDYSDEEDLPFKDLDNANAVFSNAAKGGSLRFN